MYVSFTLTSKSLLLMLIYNKYKSKITMNIKNGKTVEIIHRISRKFELENCK